MRDTVVGVVADQHFEPVQSERLSVLLAHFILHLPRLLTALPILTLFYLYFTCACGAAPNYACARLATYSRAQKYRPYLDLY